MCRSVRLRYSRACRDYRVSGGQRAFKVALRRYIGWTKLRRKDALLVQRRADQILLGILTHRGKARCRLAFLAGP